MGIIAPDIVEVSIQSIHFFICMDVKDGCERKARIDQATRFNFDYTPTMIASKG